MDQTQIFNPMGVLVALAFLVSSQVPVRRFAAAFRCEVTRDDFKFGESDKVSGSVSTPNRNLMNLLEVPILFYVLCLTLFVSGRVTDLQMMLGWIFIALRAAHSVVHLTFRLTAFALSNFVLMAMWLLFYFGPHG